MRVSEYEMVGSAPWIRDCHRCWWQKTFLRSMLPPCLTLFLVYTYFFEETINHYIILKLKPHLRENVTYWYYIILVDAEIIESARDFNTAQLRYITSIFEDTSDYIFNIYGKVINTRRLRSLLRNLVCVMRMSCNLRSLLPMITLL